MDAPPEPPCHVEYRARLELLELSVTRLTEEVERLREHEAQREASHDGD